MYYYFLLKLRSQEQFYLKIRKNIVRSSQKISKAVQFNICTYKIKHEKLIFLVVSNVYAELYMQHLPGLN